VKTYTLTFADARRSIELGLIDSLEDVKVVEDYTSLYGPAMTRVLRAYRRPTINPRTGLWSRIRSWAT
jgi:hypothetical protein